MAPFTRLSAAFTRRKSTGNVLDEVSGDSTSPSQGTFTVLNRGPRKAVISFDTPGDNRFSHASSAITRGPPDTAASSVRYSSTSTVPSSFEIEDQFSPSRSNKHLPSKSSPELFAKIPGGGAQRWTLDPPSNGSISSSDSKAPSRDRAPTASSYASTAVPPQLDAPLPALGDNSFTDLDDMFSGLGDRSARDEGRESLPKPPQRTFQRADSEPLIPTRKPFGLSQHNLPKVPSPGADAPLLQQSSRSPDPNNQSDSYPSSPEGPAVKSRTLPEPTPIALNSNLSSRQTSVSTGSGDGKGSRKVSFDATAVDKPETSRGRADFRRPSSRASDSSNSFNTSALAYAGNAPQAARRMTQKDFEAMKERETYNEKLRLDRGELIDADGPTVYEDFDDEEEEMKKIAKKREVQQAKLAVNRQKMKKIVGREDFSAASTPVRSSVSPPAATGGASPDPAFQEDHHLLPYAHNLTAPVTPQDPLKRLTLGGSLSSPNLPLGGKSGKSSGDEEDEDVPLALIQHALASKDPEVNRRMSMAGSLANGRASITPAHLMGAPRTSTRLSVIPPSGPSHDARPKSRASMASHLPVFAQHLPPPDSLPLIPGFQGSPSPSGFTTAGAQGYFPQQQFMQPPPQPGPIVYQTGGFTGPYHAAGPAPSMTLMDKVQEEERRKKGMYRTSQQPAPQPPPFQRTMTMPNMQSFNPHMSVPMLTPQQQQFMAMNGGMMGMPYGMPYGMNGMGMPGMPPGMHPGMMGMDPMGGVPGMHHPQVPSPGPSPVNDPRRRASQLQSPVTPGGSSMRNPTGYFGSGLPAIADASPPPSFVAPASFGIAPMMSGTAYAPSIAPSERSNVGMPSRYKPVTVVADSASVGAGSEHRPASPTVRATLRPLSRQPATDGANDSADDNDADNEGSGWGAMKARRARHKAASAIA